LKDRLASTPILRRPIVSRDVIKDDFGGKLPSGRPFRPDVRGRHPEVCTRPRLSRGRGFTRGHGFTRGRVFTIRRCGKNRVRANALASTRTRVRPHGRDHASARTQARPRGRDNATGRWVRPRRREKIKNKKIKKLFW
jgi:hypothetical protein